MSDNIEIKPHPGPQEKVLQCNEFEILYGGARGGGKTFGGILWLLYDKDHPNYRALVIRRNYDDLKDRIDRAKDIYRSQGGEFINGEFVFTSGAKIRLGHLKDENAYTKYQGHEYHRMIIEELTQIPNEENYLKLVSSCRSSIKALKPQVFCTANPGGIGHCVPDGEVITKHGLKSIKDIRVGDMVLTMNEDGDDIYVPVDQKVEEYYSGKIYKSKSKAIEFECTPEHKIVIQTETKNKRGRTFHNPSLRKVKDLMDVTRLPNIGERGGTQIGSLTIPYTEKRKPKYIQPLAISGDDYCELMGWYLSEGHTYTKYAMFGISQTKTENRTIIKNMLDRIGFRYREIKNGFEIYSRSWCDYLMQFGKCRDKFIPQEIKNATKEQLSIFYKYAMLGDGHGIHYYTISKQLADDMQEIGHKLGYRTYLSERQRDNRFGLSYDVSCKRNVKGYLYKSQIESYNYEGMVYCLGINELHRFYLRQNGRIYLSGNSRVKKRFIDVAAPGERYNTPEGRTRIFIPAKIEDNPTLMNNDPDYVKFLEGLPEDLRKARREGSWDVYDTKGTVYLQNIQEARADNRICEIQKEEALDYYTFWDLGISDTMVVLVVQFFGKEIRVIDCIYDEERSLQDFAVILKERGYFDAKVHYLPRDGQIREMSTKVSRQDYLKKLGLNVEITPNISIENGIHQARLQFKNCWFNKSKTEKLIEALSVYRKKRDDKNLVFKDPIHDRSSHFADAFRYLCINTPNITQIKKSIDRPKAINPRTGSPIKLEGARFAY